MWSREDHYIWAGTVEREHTAYASSQVAESHQISNSRVGRVRERERARGRVWEGTREQWFRVIKRQRDRVGVRGMIEGSKCPRKKSEWEHCGMKEMEGRSRQEEEEALLLHLSDRSPWKRKKKIRKNMTICVWES